MIKKLILIIAALVLMCGVSAAKSSKGKAAQIFNAVVTHVTDGDTVWVSAGRGTKAIDVRIEGIDAPEICQEYGETAANALRMHLQKKTITVTSRGRDKYERLIAKISLNDQDVGAWLVNNGHAWSYHYRRSLGRYAQLEAAARQAGRGLWASVYPVEPKQFRKRTNCHLSHRAASVPHLRPLRSAPSY